MNPNYHISKKIGLIAGPLLFLIFYLLPIFDIEPMAQKVIAVAIWMVVWWITETVSISVTALIPLTFFPLLNIMDMKTVAANYGSPIVFLFFGGFVLALALEKVNLHKRIALNIIRLTGTSPNKIVLGFMIATASLSMWISNTATTVLMLPIALSVIKLLIDDEDGFTAQDRNFALSIMLGIAFSANVGGVATLIGTPPNSVLAGIMENEYQIQISFLKWMMMCLPFSILMLFIIYLTLVKWIYPSGLESFGSAQELIHKNLEELGPITKKEKVVLTVFGSAIFLWVFRTMLNPYLGSLHLSDAGISMLVAFVLFALPHNLSKGDFTLDWKDTVNLPWGILILFGGGLALAGGLSQAGIIDMIGSAIASKEGLGVLMIVSLLIFVMLFMTELMSNVALVAIFVPVVAGIALGLNVNILLLAIPITIASSCAFMLPMATPPNAIVFASGHVRVFDMVKAGIVLNVIAVIIIVGMAQFVIPLLF